MSSMHSLKSRFTAKLAGFSLLELLVVIAIIGILVTIGAVAFSTLQQRARDARRQGDIKAIQAAYEQYYAEHSDYDATCIALANEGYFPSGETPADPKNDDDFQYYCTPTGNGDSYCTCAELENGAGNAIDGQCNYGTGSFFCLSNLQ